MGGKKAKPAEPFTNYCRLWCFQVVARGNNAETGRSPCHVFGNNTHLNWSWKMRDLSESEWHTRTDQSHSPTAEIFKSEAKDIRGVLRETAAMVWNVRGGCDFRKLARELANERPQRRSRGMLRVMLGRLCSPGYFDLCPENHTQGLRSNP